MDDVYQAVLETVRAANPGRAVEVVDCPGAPLVGDVPRVVFKDAAGFAEGFKAVAGPYGNRELVQVYLKRQAVAVRSEDGQSSSVESHYRAEFAIPR